MPESNFIIVTQKPSTKNKRPYNKDVEKTFETREKAESKLLDLQSKKEKNIVFIDKENNTKTLFYLSLGANSYSKKELKF